MASSVSSKHTFSSAGITISKHRSRLKPDIVEALQFLKCAYRHDLIFQEEPSTYSEPEVRVASKDHTEGDADGGGWDALVEDLEEDKGYQDFEDEDVFVPEY